MLRIAIVEDEDAQAKALVSLVSSYAKEHDLPLKTQVFCNGFDFLEGYEGNFDLILMDIGMPHMDGMTCAHKLREMDESVLLLFVTSMAQYAIGGYEVGAFDFLVKPISYPFFSQKLSRALRQLQKRKEATYPLHLPERTLILEISQITYVEVYDHTLLFHTPQETYETYGKLSSLEMDERFKSFAKIGKSQLVNCQYITAIEDTTVTVAGTVLPLARRRKKECLEKMASSMGGKWR